MEITILLILLLTVSEGDIGKHILVHQKQQWNQAQDYCRHHHTELSFVSRQEDLDKLHDAVKQVDSTWIGLYRDPNNWASWKWSGGAQITYKNWESGQPSSLLEKRAFIINDGKWHDDKESAYHHFSCINVTVKEVKESWEAALRHCRGRETDLISMHSETDRMVAQTVIQKANSTERVWIGLRFLEDRWLWANDDPLDYEAWPKGGDRDHQCPMWKRCGALTKEGLWESWNCSDRLNFICN